MPNSEFSLKLFRLRERDFYLKRRLITRKFSEFSVQVSLSLPAKSEQDFDAVKAGYFMRALIPLNMSRLSICRVRGSRRKILNFSFRLRARAAALFFDRFISRYLPSLIRRQAPFRFRRLAYRSFLFSSPSLFDFELSSTRYDYFNWKYPVVVQFFSLDSAAMSAVGVKNR